MHWCLNLEAPLRGKRTVNEIKKIVAWYCFPQISISIPPHFSQPNTGSPSFHYLHKSSNSVGRATENFSICPMITLRIQLHFSSPPSPRVKIDNNLDEMQQRSTRHFTLFNFVFLPSFRIKMTWKNLFGLNHFIDCNLLQIRYGLSSTPVILVLVTFMALSRLFLEIFWYLCDYSYQLKYSRQFHYGDAGCFILCCKFLQG